MTKKQKLAALDKLEKYLLLRKATTYSLYLCNLFKWHYEEFFTKIEKDYLLSIIYLYRPERLKSYSKEYIGISRGYWPANWFIPRLKFIKKLKNKVRKGLI